tara:strand:- start:10488 stop:10751 length:264 start_codon:yes stop_codon:yes gene_type:complete
MDFKQYRENLTGQLVKINSDIVDHEDALSQLKELRARVRGGLEVLDQLEQDAPEKPQSVQKQIQSDIEELVGAKSPRTRIGKDMDSL